jgi:hypothetical protein
MQEEGIKSIEITQEACDDFLYHMDKFHENTVWGDNCRSWFKKNDRVWVWPGAVGIYPKANERVLMLHQDNPLSENSTCTTAL